MARPVDMRQQRRPAGVGASAGAAVRLPAVLRVPPQVPLRAVTVTALGALVLLQIGRASCRERV